MWDLVILNGNVIRGDGSPVQVLNIGIKDGKIGIITKKDVNGKRVLDAKGLVVSPGFIDVHSHSDMIPLMGKEYMSKIYQGVTTEVNGNCGISPVPTSLERLKEIREYIEGDFSVYKEDFDYENISSIGKLKEAVKISGNSWIKDEYLVGAGALRIAVMGFEGRQASSEEMEEMKNLLRAQLEGGAVGLSFGLIYPPGNFSDLKEIVELLKIVKEYDGIATFHMRDEGKDIVKSIGEVLEAGKESQARVHISHLKIMDRNLWGKSEDILKMVGRAKEEGIKISFDQYPYTASSTTLSVLLPEEETGERIEARGGAERIVIAATCDTLKGIEGKNLKEIAEEWNMEPRSTAYKILEESKEKTSAIYFSIDEGDMLNILSSKEGIVASDGYAYPMEPKMELGVPHPRSFGTFPKFLRLVRENKLMSLEDAVAKITSIPAKIFKFSGRGEIKVGNCADITIFDYKNIGDRADFRDPYQRPEGIVYVIVDGEIKIDDRVRREE